MKLQTSYLGFELRNPFIVGASPLSDTVSGCRQLEDHGAAAIVLRSLFEEQITMEGLTAHRQLDFAPATGEATSYLPQIEKFTFGPEEYLKHIHRLKAAIAIPVIGSLNGITPGGWLEYAKLIEQAGADALELHVYHVPHDARIGAQSIEGDTIEMVRRVKHSLGIPVAVKLSPFYTNLANLAVGLDTIGVDGLVLFNRFYQPDIDIDHLETRPNLKLSDSGELPLRLRWLAIICDRVQASLAVTGGVHQVTDAIKAIMCGARAVQMVSALLLRGTGHLQQMCKGLDAWLEEHEYESLQQMCGSMSAQRCPDSRQLLRNNYMNALQGWSESDYAER